MGNKSIYAYKILAIILIILGIVHCTMVFVYFDSLTSEAVFSLGTGIAVFFLGLLNFSASRLLIPKLLTIAIIANAIQTLFGLISLTVMNGVQAYLGIFIFLMSLIMSLIVWRGNVKTNEPKYS